MSKTLPKIPFRSATLSLKLFDFECSDWPETFAKLKTEVGKGCGCFIAKEKVGGLHDMEFGGDVAAGHYTGFSTYVAEDFDAEKEMVVDRLCSKLLKAEFILINGMVICQGDTGAIKGLLLALETGMSCTIFQKEFESFSMQELINRMGAVKQISVKNGGKAEVKTATITGTIDDLEDYNFLDPEHERTVESIKGSWVLQSGLPVALTVRRKGTLTLGAKVNDEIDVSDIQGLLAVIEGYEFPEKDEEPEDIEPEESDEAEVINQSADDLF